MANELDIRIVLAAEGGRPTAEQIELVTGEVRRAREDVERFAKMGGIGAVSVGSEKIQAARQQIESLGDELLETSLEAHDLRDALSKIDIRVEPDIYSALQSQLINTESRAANLRQELAQLPRDLREQTADSVGYLGDLDSALQALSGTARSLEQVTGIGAFGKVGGALAFGGDLAAAAEALPRLGSASAQLTANAQKAAAAIKSSVVASASEISAKISNVRATLTATTSEGNLTVARSASATAANRAALQAGVAVGGTIALIAAFKEYEKQSEKVRGTVERLVDGFPVVETELLALEDVSGLTSDQLSELVGEQEKYRTELERQKGLVTQVREEAGKAIEDFSFTDLIPDSAPFKDKFETILGVGSLFDNAFIGAVDRAQESAAHIVAGGAFEELDNQLEGVDTELSEVNQNLALLNSQAAQAAARTNDLVNELGRQVETEIERADVLRSATSDGIREQIAEIESEIDARSAAVREAQDHIGSLERGSEAFNILTAYMDENREAIEQLRQEEEFLSETALGVASVREKENREIEKNRQQLEELIQSREESTERLRAVTEQLNTLDADRAAVLDRRNREEALADSQRDREREKNAEIRAAQQARKDEKEQEAIAETRQAGADRERDIVGKVADSIVKLREDTEDKVAAVNKKFMDGELKALRDFQTQERRLIQDHNTERLRLLEDLNDDLTEAALSGNINSFLDIQKEGLKQLTRGDQDFGTDTQRRTEDFVQQREEAAAAREQQLADLRNHFQQERIERQAAARQQLNDIRDQANERVAAVREANKKTFSEVDRLQEELRLLQETFAQENADLQRTFEQEAFNARMTELQRQKLLLGREYAVLNAQVTDSLTAIGHNSIAAIARGAAEEVDNLFRGRGIGASSNNRSYSFNVQTVQIGEFATAESVNRAVSELGSQVNRNLVSLFDPS